MMMKWFMRLMCTVLLVCSLVACGKSVEKQILEQLELGQKYLEELDYENAIVAFSKAIELEPRTKTAYQQLARAYEGTGNSELAVEVLEQGFSLFPDEDVRQELIGAYVTAVSEYRDNSEQVIRCYTRLIELEPVHVEHYLKLAEEYLNAGDVEKALETLHEGKEKTGDERILQKLEEVKARQESREAAEKNAQALAEHEAVLQELFTLYELDEWQELGEYIWSAEYESLVNSITEPCFYEVENGLYIGIGADAIYFGEVNHGVREGHGMSILSSMSRRTGRISVERYEGRWKDGYPNGEGEVIIADSLRVTGNYKDGYEDGDMVMYDTFDEETVVFRYHSDDGVPVKLADMPDDPEVYIFSYGPNGEDISIEYGRKYGVWGFMKGDEYNPDWGY